MPTPDPSAVPVNVFIAGLSGAGLDYARLVVFSVVVGLGFLVFVMAALSGIVLAKD